MTYSIEDQIQVLLYGDAYQWGISTGAIKRGDGLVSDKIFTLKQRDLIAYFEDHPVPGIDVDVDTYHGSRDGLKWELQNGTYSIGWQERGGFRPELTAVSPDEFRATWILYLVGIFQLPE
jgi:hypothetical protein